MSYITTAIVALKTLILVLGGLITYFALKAYLRTGGRELRALAVGFGVVTLGALLAGAADQVINTPQNQALLVESLLTAVGFGVIVYSLYVE